MGLSKCIPLAMRGHTMMIPELSNWSFAKACRQAQEYVDFIKPELIVGGSRGGAIGLNINADCPRILLAPAWRAFMVTPKFNEHKIHIVHGLEDGMIAPRDSHILQKTNRPNIKLHLLERVGHQCYERSAIQKINKIVNAYRYAPHVIAG